MDAYGKAIEGLSGPIHGAAQFVERCTGCWIECGKAHYKAPGGEHGKVLCSLCALDYKQEAKEQG